PKAASPICHRNSETVVRRTAPSVVFRITLCRTLSCPRRKVEIPCDLVESSLRGRTAWHSKTIILKKFGNCRRLAEVEKCFSRVRAFGRLEDHTGLLDGWVISSWYFGEMPFVLHGGRDG